MGKYEKGILGPFAGLVGTVVGAKFRKIEVMKSKPRKSTKPPKASQINQRSKFGLMINFLSRVRPFINIAFKPASAQQSPMNAAMRFNANEAIIGTAPKFAIDYSKIVISNGMLNSVKILGYTATEGSKITITWEKEYTTQFSPLEKPIRDLDEIRVFLYDETMNASLAGSHVATRSSGQIVMTAPFDEGDKVHAWIFFTSQDQSVCTPSRYLGTINLIY